MCRIEWVPLMNGQQYVRAYAARESIADPINELRRPPSDDSDRTLVNARLDLVRGRQRKNLLGSSRFMDGPAWEMLVDLYVHQLEGKRLSIGALCVTCGVPMTNAVRILSKLVTAGLVCRTPDPKDARRCFIALDPVLSDSLNRYFASG